MPIPDEHLKKLRKAYAGHNLTLYLGAGVSVGSGLPSWEKLVVSMYLDSVKEHKENVWLPRNS